MLMRELGQRSRIWRYAIPPFAAAVVVTLWLLLKPFSESFAFGLLLGGLPTIAVLTALQYLGRRRRAGLAGRVAAHETDERDRQIALRAGAAAGYVTLAALTLCAIMLAVHPFRGMIVAALAMWVYLIALLVAYVVYGRRL